MSITIQNLRIIPYGQKDTLKPVFGDTMHLTFRLADAPQDGDGYTLALDYERILLPTMRPLCAMATEYTAAGTDISFELEINTERFAAWASGLKKPTPIWLQLQRERGGVYTTLLLDDVLALPSVVDGANMVFPGTPLEDALKKKLDKPTEAGHTGNVLKLGEDGKPVWGDGGGGSAQQATDAEIDARESTTHAITPNNLDYAARSVLPNVTTIPAATTSYSLLDASATTNNHSWQYFHAPGAASTYVFPAVADTAVAHRIKLTIDFTAVQTYSFEDASGNALTPLFTPTIAAGDVYEFDCEYSAVKNQWLIWPHKQGAVSDDYVMQSQVGAANGVAPLDSSSLVPSANLQKATDTQFGTVKFVDIYGIAKYQDGVARLQVASQTQISNRTGDYRIISPSNINYVVTATLTDSHKIQLTDAQKASAQDTLGIAATIIGTTAPTTSTAGSVGQLYVDTTTSKTYHCTAVVTSGDPEVTTYTWTNDINAKGGRFDGTVSIASNGASYSTGYLAFCVGYRAKAAGNYSFALGYNATTTYTGEFSLNYNGDAHYAQSLVCAMSTAQSDIVGMLYHQGDLYIAGGHQQGITIIPSATTAYTLAEGMQSHVPEAASVYALPPVIDSTRTHECILTVRFSSSVLTYAFEDAEGNAITPLPLAGTIADGSVVAFRCTWEALLGQWVIMPVMMGTYEEAEP